MRSTTRHPAALLLSFAALAAALAAQGPPGGFAETYALAADRAKAVALLLPGTDGWYYWRCRERLDARDFATVRELLPAWIRAHGASARTTEIENREALLSVDDDPQGTFAFLRNKLGLEFDQVRSVPGAPTNLPTRLDPALLDPAVLTKQALQEKPATVDGFTDRALPALLQGALDADTLHSLLGRLKRADLPNIPALVVRDLDHRQSGGFGSLLVHRELRLAQLEECARLRPALLQQPAFVTAMLERLSPAPGDAWPADPTARTALLQRLHAFAWRLGPRFHSLQAHVLFHWLQHDLTQGAPDEERFLAYIRLPRRTGFVAADHLRGQQDAEASVDTSAKFATGLPPIDDDVPLVRTCLEHFFATEDDLAPYAPFLDAAWLDQVLSETKLLVGRGDSSAWTARFPEATAALAQRTEIVFPPTSPRDFAPTDAVALEVRTKNVPRLLVRVFAIDTFRYHQERLRDVDASLDLDGVAPTHEEVHTFAEPPIRRVTRRFALPMLQGPGTWIVEFVGNGQRCRAVVHKGQLRHTERPSAAGHVFQVHDETGTPLRDAFVWFGGREYAADERAEILVPFSTEPAQKTVVLRHGQRSSLATFAHEVETWSLQNGVFVDREALIAGATAKVLVRPRLTVAGQPASLQILQKPLLRIVATDLDGRTVPQEVHDLVLRDDRELVHEITVPPRLQSLHVSLRGTVKDLAGKDVALQSEVVSFDCNGMDATPATSSPMLLRTPGGYAVEVRGKDGEVRAGQVCRLQLWHHAYERLVDVMLQTDDSGRIDLGPLVDVDSVQVTHDRKFHAVALAAPGLSLPRSLHGRTGEVLRVPYQGEAKAPGREEFSLLGHTDDAFRHLSLTDGFLELRDLPAGRYQLHLHATGNMIPVTVIAAERHTSWLMGEHRALQASPTLPLHVRGIEVVGTDVVVRLANPTADTRVHVTATRTLPTFDLFAHLRGERLPPLERTSRPLQNRYVATQALGDEHRYVLERRFLTKFPGNMLPRPSLLVAPWVLDDSAIGSEGAFEGDQWGSVVGVGGGAGPRYSEAGAAASQGRWQPGRFANLDWMPSPSTLQSNLVPDRDGIVRIPLASLGTGHLISVLAIDGDQAVQDTLVRDEQPIQPRSRRLPQALDGTQPFHEQKRIEFVAAGGEAVLGTAVATQAEVFGSLGDVFRAFLAVNPEQASLAQFAFLLEWPKLPDARKRELYGQHACHELHFFLRHKDPAFFAQVVRPLLANKLRPTFLDRWLLDADLTPFLEPWAFGQLHLVERILLAQRLDEAGRGRITRLVREDLDLRPVPVDRQELLFDLGMSVLSFDEFDSVSLYIGIGGAEPGVRVLDLNAFGQGEDRAVRRFAANDEEEEMPPYLKPGEPGAPTQSKNERSFDNTTDEQTKKESAFDSNNWNRAVGLGDDAKRRGQARALFRAVSPTQRFVEHDWWQRRIDQTTPDIVAPNRFWADYATAPAGQPFVSTAILQASGSFLESMLALAVLDLPFEAGKHETTTNGDLRTLRAARPLLLVKKEITKAEAAAAEAPLLLGENFFRVDERHRFVEGEKRDAFVTGEFLVDTAYGCQVVVTNPTSSRRIVDLLLQVPAGAIPVQSGFWTKGVRVDLQPYTTQTFEYAFYFPAAGDSAHYPVHATERGRVAAAATPRTLRVVPTPTTVDTTSWENVSQQGTGDAVLAHLDSANLGRIDLSRIAWRMHDRAFFAAVLGTLRARHAFDATLWSFGILHRDPVATRECLERADAFVQACGTALASPLLTIDPVARRRYQHLELDPLVHPRAHRFGTEPFGNVDLARQHHALMDLLGYQPRLTAEDWLAVTYYQLLQDRIEDALASFAKVDPTRVATKLQYDYLHAYICFFTGDTATARALAERHRAHPVPHWQQRFALVLAQLDEAEGRTPQPTGEPSADERAAMAPTLELAMQGQQVLVRARNLARCEVLWFPLDVEFAFSAQPFARADDTAAAFVRAAVRETTDVPVSGELRLDRPASLRDRHVRVEVRGEGLVRSRTCLASAVVVRFLESHGQVAVAEPGTDRPLSKAYVKVFAKLADGTVRFHKDGYTDLRGRFDYASLSDDPNAGAVRYAVLVLDETRGAVIRDVPPPAR